MTLAGQRLLQEADTGGAERHRAQPRAVQAALAERHHAPMRDWIEGFVRTWLAESPAVAGASGS